MIAIGWKEFGDLKALEPTREAFKEHYKAVYADAQKGSIGTGAGVLYRFCYEMQVGDYVVYPSKIDRQINLGVVESDYMYVPEAAEYVQQRNLARCIIWSHLPINRYYLVVLLQFDCLICLPDRSDNFHTIGAIVFNNSIKIRKTGFGMVNETAPKPVFFRF